MYGGDLSDSASPLSKPAPDGKESKRFSGPSKPSEEELTEQLIALAVKYHILPLLEFWTDKLACTLSSANLLSRALLASKFKLRPLLVQHAETQITHLTSLQERCRAFAGDRSADFFAALLAAQWTDSTATAADLLVGREKESQMAVTAAAPSPIWVRDFAK